MSADGPVLPDLGEVVLVRDAAAIGPAEFRVIVAEAVGDQVRLTGWFLDADPLREQTIHVPRTAIRPTGRP